MRRIFWDTMLFIYMLDGEPVAAAKVKTIFARSLEKNDLLVTSWLAVSEVLAGVGSSRTYDRIEQAIRALPFKTLAFDEHCCAAFARLRSQKVGVADSIHLACAAAFGADLFLTNDRALHKLHVPGIKFIAGPDSGLV